MKLDIERVVVFGHKPATGRNALGLRRRTHTHSYIHGGYFKGFSALGYETYWLDENSKELESLPMKGTLFFTEDQVDEKIPLAANAFYVTHSSSKNKYEEAGASRLNLCNFVADLREGVSFNYPGQRVEKIDDITFVDTFSKALYQPWATNLLPSEIDINDVVPFDHSRRIINYVGTIGHDNIEPRFRQFKKAAARAGATVKLHSGVADQDARTLIRDSLITVDIRGDWHLERGYVPCRLWKNLSYGMHVGSNSQALEEIFMEHVTFESDSEALFEQTLRESKSRHLSERRASMAWIRDNHTYLHRARNVISALQGLEC
jgi:hypothetical protein